MESVEGFKMTKHGNLKTVLVDFVKCLFKILVFYEQS